MTVSPSTSPLVRERVGLGGEHLEAALAERRRVASQVDERPHECVELLVASGAIPDHRPPRGQLRRARQPDLVAIEEARNAGVREEDAESQSDQAGILADDAPDARRVMAADEVVLLACDRPRHAGAERRPRVDERGRRRRPAAHDNGRPMGAQERPGQPRPERRRKAAARTRTRTVSPSARRVAPRLSARRT